MDPALASRAAATVAEVVKEVMTDEYRRKVRAEIRAEVKRECHKGLMEAKEELKSQLFDLIAETKLEPGAEAQVMEIAIGFGDLVDRFTASKFYDVRMEVRKRDQAKKAQTKKDSEPVPPPLAPPLPFPEPEPEPQTEQVLNTAAACTRTYPFQWFDGNTNQRQLSVKGQVMALNIAKFGP